MKCHFKLYLDIELPGSVRFINMRTKQNKTKNQRRLYAMACLIWLQDPFPIKLGHRESSALNSVLPLI